MDLSEKGWFSELLKNKQTKPNTNIARDKGEFIYKSIQPSGLMYGHPIVPKEYSNENFLELDSSEKLKLVLLDGFVKTAIFPSDAVVPTDSDEYVRFMSKVIVEFYEHAYPNNQIKSKTFWGKKLSNEEVVENLINNRLNSSSQQSYWGEFFNNSLLFLDVIFFGEWISHSVENRSSLIDQLERTHQILLEVMIAASYSDGTLAEEEKKLFSDLLKSIPLPKEKSDCITNLLETGQLIENINLSEIKTWILKKYVLELAILFVWADKIVTEEEKDFINQLGSKLSFNQAEIERSMVAIESFVVSNWGNVSFLQNKNNFNVISNQFICRLSKVVTENEKMVSSQIKDNEELMLLLVKSAKKELTKEEQITVRNQLIEVLKHLPTLVIIALPGSFLTLPLLMKILPESALSCSLKKKK